MGEQNLQVTSIRLSEEDKKKIEELAKTKGISVSELIREWINKEHEQQDLKSYLRVGLNKNLYMVLRVLHGDDSTKIESEYNQYKLT